MKDGGHDNAHDGVEEPTSLHGLVHLWCRFPLVIVGAFGSIAVGQAHQLAGDPEALGDPD